MLLEDEASPQTINLLPEACLAETRLIACYTDLPHLKLIATEPLQANQPYEWVSPSTILPKGFIKRKVASKKSGQKVILTHSRPWRSLPSDSDRDIEVLMFGTGNGDNRDDRIWKSIPLKGLNGLPITKDREFYQNLGQALENTELLTQSDLEDWSQIHDISMASLMQLIEQVQPDHPVIIERERSRRRLESERIQKRRNERKRKSAQYPTTSPRMRQAASQGYGVFIDPQFIKILIEAFKNGELHDDAQIATFCMDQDVEPDLVKRWITKHTGQTRQAEPTLPLSKEALQPPHTVMTPFHGAMQQAPPCNGMTQTVSIRLCPPAFFWKPLVPAPTPPEPEKKDDQNNSDNVD